MAGRPQHLDDPPGAAFLLTAIGTHAASRFAERIAALGITPPQTGLLRAIATTPGQSQQAVATLLRVPPSRLVALVDTLAERGLVERRRNLTDRRLHELHATAAGHALLRRVAELGREHDDAICAALDTGERATLRALLTRIAADQGLTPGVHPGYRYV